MSTSDRARMDGPAPVPTSGFERSWIVGLCLVAALRVFVQAAAFPFFTNMDEQAHVDLVLKYARGYWPAQPEEPYDTAAAELFVTYGTLEYVNPAARFPGGTAGPPLWRQPPDAVAAAVASGVARWQARTNHEAHSPPLYYVVAAAWYRAGRALDLTGGELLYWLRFLNVPLVALMVWCTHRYCRSGFPDRRDLRLGVPLLAAFVPYDAFYAVNGDALAPLLAVVTLLAILAWQRSPSPGIGTSVAVGGLAALNVLLKYTQGAIACVFVALCVGRAFRALRAHASWRKLLAPCCGAASVALIVGALVARNYVQFGDATGTADKIRVLGWTRLTLPEVFRHPIFTPTGFAAFWSRLMQTLWRGEMRWHLEPIASTSADAYYVATSSLLLTLAALGTLAALWRLRRAPSGAGPGVACAMNWAVVALSVTWLALLSALFDYGACFYPSREFPYLASGRLIGAALIPFLVLYLDGAAYLFRPLARVFGAHAGSVATITFAALTCVVATVSEAALTRPFFANPYNWFHLP